MSGGIMFRWYPEARVLRAITSRTDAALESVADLLFQRLISGAGWPESLK